MSVFRKFALVAIGAVGLSGCATFDPYGTSVGVGVGSRYYDPYYGGGYAYGGQHPYGGYGSYGSYGSYGAQSGGWYNNYYYPGTGVYVYDRQRRRYRISDAQRRYYEQQRVYRQVSPAVRENVRQYRVERRDDRRVYRVERRDDREALRRGEVTREQYRTDRRQDRREARQDGREDQRQLRRENRRDRRQPN
jgi:hypothetical protein